MKKLPYIFQLFLFLLVACGNATPITSSPPTLTIAPSLSPSATFNSNRIYLMDNYQFYLMSCPFFECLKVFQLESGTYIEAISNDGRSQDINSGNVWLQVNYDGNKSGWLFVKPDRVVIPEGLLDRLPVAEWKAPTPIPTPTVDPVYNLRSLCAYNVDSINYPNPGFTKRFKTPIKIYAPGVDTIKAAIERFEYYSNGVITFEIVDEEPLVGVIVDEGDARSWNDNGPDCGGWGDGLVTASSDPCDKTQEIFSIGNDGYVNSQVFVHLGSPGHDHKNNNGIGRYLPSATTEHELAHAIGSGMEDVNPGLTYDNAMMLTTLYSMPSGTDMVSACAGK